MRKMVLVDAQMLNSVLKKDQIQSTPELDEVVRLDNAMQDILRQNIPIHEKVRKYNDILLQYIHFRKEIQHKIEKDPILVAATTGQRADEGEKEEKNAHDDILRGLPKSSHRNAQLLLEMLKNNNIINWDRSTKHLIYKGQELENTNIRDLIYHTVVPNKQQPPNGNDEFSRGLDALNIPKNLRRNKQQIPTKRARASSEGLGFTTPSSSPSRGGKVKTPERWLNL
jgi:hypothetical protein